MKIQKHEIRVRRGWRKISAKFERLDVHCGTVAFAGVVFWKRIAEGRRVELFWRENGGRESAVRKGAGGENIGHGKLIAKS